MSIVDGGPAAGLLERVRAILLQPRTTWEIIEAEPTSIRALYRGYVAPLAAIIPVILFLWTVVISPVFGLGAPLLLAGALIDLVVSYVIALAGVWAFAWIADRLAAGFGATRGLLPAFKVGVYGMTAVWVSGLCLLVPIFGPLGLIAGGVYSVYLIHLGLKQLMKPAADKAAAYTAVTILATVGVVAVANAVLEALV
jgi:hypothetical protein